MLEDNGLFLSAAGRNGTPGRDVILCAPGPNDTPGRDGISGRDGAGRAVSGCDVTSGREVTLGRDATPLLLLLEGSCGCGKCRERRLVSGELGAEPVLKTR